jgi:hypothetical protein
MKTIALTLFVAALGCAQNQPPSAAAGTQAQVAATAAHKKKPAPASTPSPAQKAKAESQTQTIPPGASQIEPNLYRYTDLSGKTWLYRQTPFGISKWEETSTPASQPIAKSDPVAVTDLGDSVRFEKKTPFGGSTWVRKKTELTDEEKALVAANPASQVADKTKEEK